MPVSVGDDIHLYLGPDSAAPSSTRLDDLEAAIVDFIDGATKRLDIAVQELESRPITEAILRAEIERKVSVRLVLEADYLTAKRRPKTVEAAFESAGALESNRLLAAAAMRATAWVRADFNPHIFHQKFIIRDGSAVLTGSTNFTPTGVGRAPKGGGNLNHVLTVRSVALARVYQKEFNQIKDGIFGARSALSPHPKPVVVDGVTFKVCFAPEHNPEMEIAKQINKAKERIDFAIFTFAQSSGIDDALKMAMRAGVDVSGVMDGAQANQKWAASKGLVEAGAKLWLIAKNARVNKLHHKMMAVDDRALVLGSFNYTGPANSLNDENIVVIYSEDPANPALPLIEAARDEISRIKRWHGEQMKA